MPVFDRITIEKSKFSDYATIRNTGIAVSEIVSRLSRGESMSVVLAAYPKLETEDLVQALAYAADDMLERTAVLVHDARKPLSLILGYAGMLTEAEVSPEERMMFAQEIVDHAGKGADGWGELSEETRLKYGFQAIAAAQISQVNLKEIFTEISDEIQRKGITLKTDFPADLPLLRGNRLLGRAFVLLCTDAKLDFLKAEACVTARVDNGEIVIEIERPLASKSNTPLPPMGSFFTQVTGGLYVAGRMIEQVGGSMSAAVDDLLLRFTARLKT